MNKYKKVLLGLNATIKEALEIIDKGAMKIALVVDKDNKLIGTVTDGDIRRGLLSGIGFDDSVEKVIFRNPTVCTIEDDREKIIDIAVEKKIYQIPIVNNDGILVGIESLEDLIKPKQFSNKVILMAGGLGTRLRPLTDDTPKPLLKVGDKPILETIILNFKKYGFTDIILSVSYKSEMIEEYFGDGEAFGVKITYIHEDKRMGTAGALSLMKNFLNEPFFVMNGDLLTNINFDFMRDYHLLNDSIATMGVREYDFQVPYGVVEVKDSLIKSIKEKPVHKFFISGGVYMLSPDVLKHIPDNEYFDMPSLFDKVIENEEKAISFPIREYWLDIGRIEEFERANSEYYEVF